MAPGRYTRLFFLDEVTALSAGAPALRHMPARALQVLHRCLVSSSWPSRRRALDASGDRQDPACRPDRSKRGQGHVSGKAGGSSGWHDLHRRRGPDPTLERRFPAMEFLWLPGCGRTAIGGCQCPDAETPRRALFSRLDARSTCMSVTVRAPVQPWPPSRTGRSRLTPPGTGRLLAPRDPQCFPDGVGLQRPPSHLGLTGRDD